jgi:tryptophan synthase alpha chain
MKNRLLTKVSEVQKKGGKFFCAFLTLGYPSIPGVAKMALEFEKSGVDILELGFPFSDPLADGPTIQFSSEYALRKGVAIGDSFRLVEELRRKGMRIPVIFFSYLNPICHYGVDAFMKRAREAGFDGVIVPDMLPGSEATFNRACKRSGISQVFLVAPTTPEKRALAIAKKSEGFLYYVSLRGVTGARKAVPQDIQEAIGKINRAVRKPVLIGFGVSSPEQAKKLSAMSQGVIVGSAIIDKIRASGGKTGPAIRFVQQMVRAVKGKG